MDLYTFRLCVWYEGLYRKLRETSTLATILLKYEHTNNADPTSSHVAPLETS